MPNSQALIDTDRPGRYLVQLCRHAAAMGGGRGHRLRIHVGGGALARSEVQVHAEWSDTHGCVTFDPWGRATMQADSRTLTVTVDAADEEDLLRVQEILTRDLGRIGRRDHLIVNWRRSDTTGVATGTEPSA